MKNVKFICLLVLFSSVIFMLAGCEEEYYTSTDLQRSHPLNGWANTFFVISIIGLIIFLINLVYDLAGNNTSLANNLKWLFPIFFIPTLLFGTLNFFCFPGKETRYIPYTQIAWSLDGVNTIESISDLAVDEPIYLQIRINIASNSFARRFLHDNRIPVTVTISNPEVAEYNVQRSRDFEEINPPQKDNTATIYQFAVYASRTGEEQAIITLYGKANIAGTQTVRIRFSDKVSGKYEIVDTLTFVSYDPYLYFIE